MSERTFTIVMTDHERLMALTALGFCYAHLPQVRPLIVINDLIDKLTKAAAVETENNPRTIPAPPVAAPPPRDYFQRDRKGNEQTSPPTDAALKTVRIVGTQEQKSKTPGKAAFLKVIFQSGQASCFDSNLFPLIIKRTGEEAALWFVQSGKYWNIVGVRA